MSRAENDAPNPSVSQHVDRRPLSEDARGTLVLIGGACTARGRALRAFLDRTGATDGSRIVGLTTASSRPVESARAWMADLTAVGARNAEIPQFERYNFERDLEIAAMVRDARGIFLGGGDQVKLVSALTGSATLKALKASYLHGAVVCGTSAGAAALTELTMAGGEIDEEGQLVEQYIGPGLGLLGCNTIVDTHFSQRRRLQRLFVVIAGNSQLLGLGIDEDTAFIVNGHVGEVAGAGGVTFVDGRTVHYDNAEEMEKGRQLTLSYLRVGVVGTGHSLDLEERELEFS